MGFRQQNCKAWFRCIEGSLNRKGLLIAVDRGVGDPCTYFHSSARRVGGRVSGAELTSKPEERRAVESEALSESLLQLNLTDFGFQAGCADKVPCKHPLHPTHNSQMCVVYFDGILVMRNCYTPTLHVQFLFNLLAKQLQEQLYMATLVFNIVSACLMLIKSPVIHTSSSSTVSGSHFTIRTESCHY